jgi:hypothetical protein
VLFVPEQLRFTRRPGQTLAAVSLVLAILPSCSADQGPRGTDVSGGAGEQVVADATTPATAQQKGWFAEHGEDVGLAFVQFNGMSGEFYFPEMLTGGVGLLDYDADGDLDVFLTQGQMLGGRKTDEARLPPATALPLSGRLYRNDLQVRADGGGSLHFTGVTQSSGIDARGYGMGVAAADYDNNGCVDLYLTNFGPNQLLRNNCDGTFTDVSQGSGTDGPGWSVSASFLDYDRDGWLDLYVGDYVQYDIKADRKCTGLTGRRDGSYASASDPRVLVGLGESTEAPRVRVHWPAGGDEERSAVAVDRWTTLTEGEAGRAAATVPRSKAGPR